MNKKVSIIVCTRDRMEYVRNCLGSLSELDIPVSDFEVILVDNGSTDGTREIVSEFSTGMDIQYLFEPVPGLSRARNTGLEHAGSEITVFLDDDAEVCPAWLSEILGPFDEYGDEVCIVAGDVDPVWAGGRPDWLDDRYLGFYSAGLNWDTVPRFMEQNEWILECNMAIRTEALKRKGGFNESLGRVGGALLSCEGVVFEEIRREGNRAFYNPRARVRHHIHQDRLNKTWLLRRSLSQGISTAILSEYFPRERDIPNVGFNLKALFEQDIESLSPNDLFRLVMLLDRLGYALKKKKLL